TPIDDNDLFCFVRKFHNEFNENLAKTITSGDMLCIDKSISNARTNLFLQLDSVEPPEYSSKKKFAEHSVTIATMLLLTEPWFSSGRTIIANSWFGSVKACTTLYKHVGKFDDVDLTLCSLRDRKNIVLLASCSTTNFKNEITRYIKGHGNVKFHRPTVFDEYNEYRSAVDILNNLRDNALSYYDVLTTKCSENRILAFYFSVAKANSYSAYCQFVPGKKNMKHVDFCKHLVISIFDYYSEDETVDDSSSSRLKGKHIQRHCISCHKRTTTGCRCSMPQAMCSN
ncbi:8872_t:CDS:2, partial [Diversispora eburnea]